MGTNIFDLVTLTLKFDLLLKKFNIGHSFLTRRESLSYLCPPLKKEGHIALHMSVRPSVGRYVGLP